MGRTDEYQSATTPFDGYKKEAEVAPEKKVFCDIFMDGVILLALYGSPVR